ncbi:respiratory nitrate reductase subunit gamma [Enterobacter cloacae]|uniref:nitrate reductase (quinone) n=1 Tax=Enterobacter cloacae TaxID=550 RepID=A0A377M0B8_ENTCL|nr:respiratory nitrate reductase subunit gamma [Enterobacter cloacae]
MHFLNMFFFDIYPYIAGTVFLVGSWLRYDYGQYTWRAASSQMLDRKGMHVASNLFHIGILGIFAGHFLGMLTPHWMYEAWLPIEVKQKMAMIAGGACGVMTLVGGLLLLKRRLFSPRVRLHYHGGYPDPLSADGSVRTGSADHSILGAAYGRQRDDEAGGMGAVP